MGMVRKRDYIKQKHKGIEKKYKAIQLKGGKCVMCGENRLPALCFHHRDPELKGFGLDSRSFTDRRWDKLEPELEKCDLLCHNCHSIIHNTEVWSQIVSDSGPALVS